MSEVTIASLKVTLSRLDGLEKRLRDLMGKAGLTIKEEEVDNDAEEND